MQYVNMKTIREKATNKQHSRSPCNIVASDGSRIMQDGEIRIATKPPLKALHGRYCMRTLSPKKFLFDTPI